MNSLTISERIPGRIFQGNPTEIPEEIKEVSSEKKMPGGVSEGHL